MVDSNMKISIGIIIFKKVLETIYVDENDYLNITKLKNPKLNEYIINTNTITARYSDFKKIINIVIEVLDNKLYVENINQYNKTKKLRKKIYDSSSDKLRKIYDFYTHNGQYLDIIDIINIDDTGYLKKYLKYKIKYLTLRQKIKF
jgi:hypothetical protein